MSMSNTMAQTRCACAVAVLATHLVHLTRYADRACSSAAKGYDVDRQMALEAIFGMEEQLANAKAVLQSMDPYASPPGAGLRPITASRIEGMVA